jgi:hypothetical protein
MHLFTYAYIHIYENTHTYLSIGKGNKNQIIYNSVILIKYLQINFLSVQDLYT